MNLINRITTCLAALILLLGAGTMNSCVSEDLIEQGPEKSGQNGNEESGDALLSFRLFMDNSGTQPQTRAGETYMNLIQEKLIKDVRVILYDASGTARYIVDYDIHNTNDWVSGSPNYQTKPIKVKPQNYEVAVLINHKNKWNYFAGGYDANTSIELRTSLLGHNKSVLTDMPLDFSAGGSPYANAKTMAMQTLIGGFDTPPAYASPAYITDYYRFFMSNADGLLSITTDQIKSTEALAKQFPVALYLERAVAKVGFLRNENVRVADNIAVMQVIGNQVPPRTNSPDDYKHFHELDIDNDYSLVRWRTDMINMKTYPIRKKAQIAPYPVGPGVGLSMEVDDTDRRDRYAIDPNHTTTAAAIGGELFTIPTDGDGKDPIYATISAPAWSGYSSDYLGLPLKVGKGHATDTEINVLDNLYEYDHFEYVTENTMTPENYNTATATNILVRVPIAAYFVYAKEYRSGGMRSITPFIGLFQYSLRYDFFGDYVVYKDKVYPLEVVYGWLYNGRFQDSGGNNYQIPWFYDPRTDYNFLRSHYDNRIYTTELKDAGIEPISAADFIADFGEWNDMTPAKVAMRNDLKANIESKFQSAINEVQRTLTLTTKEAGEIHGVKFYKDGFNYYRVPVRHFSDAQSPNTDSYGRYGVVRNNIYVMRLDAINGLGEPTPGPGEEIEEPDPDNHLSVGFHVLPWLTREQDVDLNNETK